METNKLTCALSTYEDITAIEVDSIVEMLPNKVDSKNKEDKEYVILNAAILSTRMTPARKISPV